MVSTLWASWICWPLYWHRSFIPLCAFGPAISAAIPGMVKRDELVHANALNSLSRSATGLLGPVIGAFFLGFLGYTVVFL